MLCSSWQGLIAAAAEAPASDEVPDGKTLPVARGVEVPDPQWYCPSPCAREHTLRYLFFHMRCGIYVRLRQQRVETFLPFANPHYENDWAWEALPRDLHSPLAPRHWWANGRVLCNQPQRQLWGLHFVSAMREMLEALCATYCIPDLELAMNKRDFPQLRLDGGEPYTAFTGGPLRSENFGRDHLPVLSFYSDPAVYADLLWPLPEDWALAQAPLGRTVPWAQRQDRVVFRGSATGAGTTAATNQRMAAAALSFPWLEVGLTGWNKRWKKLHREAPLQQPSEQGPLAARLSMTQQQQYRYVLYLAGHCASSRYSALLRTGCVIFKAEAPAGVPDQLWFFRYLTPWRDYVPVAADLSDLEERYRWCLAHPEDCRAMVQRCRQLVRTVLSRQGILRYCACLLRRIGQLPTHPAPAPSWQYELQKTPVGRLS